MKNLLAGLLILTSISSFADEGPFTNKNFSNVCKKQIVSRDGYSMVCNGANNSEMEVKVQVNQRLNLAGELVSVSVK
jgi:hypothetical protein